MPRPGVDLSRFWEVPVKDGDCWLWERSRFADGYGRVNLGGKALKAHRVAYELACGEIPVGMLVCHRCDVKNCVNPAHLFLGDVQANTDDMIAKGRQRYPGPHNPATGDRNASRLYPERFPRGEKHYTQTHPERVRRGEQIKVAVLTVEHVVQMRRLYAEGGYSYATLGKRFGVSKRTALLAIKRATWRHVLD